MTPTTPAATFIADGRRLGEPALLIATEPNELPITMLDARETLDLFMDGNVPNEDDRGREVALLQQRAGALEAEIEHRKQLEVALHESVETHRANEKRLAASAAKNERLDRMAMHANRANSVKFSESGGRIVVAIDRDETHASITMLDEGRGITPEFLPHVFQPFRQADGTSTRSYGGLGFGLAIVKLVTELHGGNVIATSDGDGRGATFVVRLPLPA